MVTSITSITTQPAIKALLLEWVSLCRLIVTSPHRYVTSSLRHLIVTSANHYVIVFLRHCIIIVFFYYYGIVLLCYCTITLQRHRHNAIASLVAPVPTLERSIEFKKNISVAHYSSVISSFSHSSVNASHCVIEYISNFIHTYIYLFSFIYFIFFKSVGFFICGHLIMSMLIISTPYILSHTPFYKYYNFFIFL